MCGQHHLTPDLGRQLTAGDVVHGGPVVIADPHAADPVGREAHKPGVTPILGGAGLSRGRPPERRAHPGPVGQHPLHHPHHLGGVGHVIDSRAGRGHPGEQGLAARRGNLLDQMRVGPLATLLEHLIGAGQFQQIDLIGAQGQRQVRLVGNAFDAKTMSQLGHLRGADLVGQAHGHGVDRVGQGLGQGHRPAIAGFVVGRSPGTKAHGGVLADVGRLDPGLHGGGVDKRLERRAGLALGLSHPVEGGQVVVGAAHQGADSAIGTEQHQGSLARAGARTILNQGLMHDRLGRGLQTGVDGQLNHQIGGLGAGDLHRLGGGHVQHIAIVALARGLRGQPGRSGQGGLVLGGRDPALRQHVGQHDMRAGQGGVHVVGQGQAGRRLGQGGQERGFLQIQVTRRLAEIGLGGGVDTIGVVAEEDAVEIEFQHLILGHHLLQAIGDHRFLQLAAQGLVGRKEQGFGQLLGQGRAALDRAVRAPIDPGGAGYATQVHGAVLIEPLVLHRQKGMRHIGRQFGHGDRIAVLGPAPGYHRAAGVLEGHPRSLVDHHQSGPVGDVWNPRQKVADHPDLGPGEQPQHQGHAQRHQAEQSPGDLAARSARAAAPTAHAEGLARARALRRGRRRWRVRGRKHPVVHEKRNLTVWPHGRWEVGRLHWLYERTRQAPEALLGDQAPRTDELGGMGEPMRWLRPVLSHSFRG